MDVMSPLSASSRGRSVPAKGRVVALSRTSSGSSTSSGSTTPAS